MTNGIGRKGTANTPEATPGSIAGGTRMEKEGIVIEGVETVVVLDRDHYPLTQHRHRLNLSRGPDLPRNDDDIPARNRIAGRNLINNIGEETSVGAAAVAAMATAVAMVHLPSLVNLQHHPNFRTWRKREPSWNDWHDAVGKDSVS
eukprot:CAMPEP_0201614674 /NCGR_PEP_ID=MMETSP0492-20130828/29339_1 /ASSEMBLY_ACC=CAM_ASM_000837 /TAXON_ID=420259 /ORGANISM="Thalassiosira gravida, Strain GMp14c1" /LENGTH=145 /DNA_ID=CAMNT_0048082045 /DNA_START=126 /DNA_END=559 /DNA_ORIENTATION=-